MITCQKSRRIAVYVSVIVMLMSAAHHRDRMTSPTQTMHAIGHHFDFDLSLPGIRAHLSTGSAR